MDLMWLVSILIFKRKTLYLIESFDRENGEVHGIESDFGKDEGMYCKLPNDDVIMPRLEIYRQFAYKGTVNVPISSFSTSGQSSFNTCTAIFLVTVLHQIAYGNVDYGLCIATGEKLGLRAKHKLGRPDHDYMEINDITSQFDLGFRIDQFYFTSTNLTAEVGTIIDQLEPHKLRHSGCMYCTFDFE